MIITSTINITAYTVMHCCIVNLSCQVVHAVSCLEGILSSFGYSIQPLAGIVSFDKTHSILIFLIHYQYSVSVLLQHLCMLLPCLILQQASFKQLVCISGTAVYLHRIFVAQVCWCYCHSSIRILSFAV